VTDLASDFYSGLVADLYEPLAGSLADPEQFVRFVTKWGTPALELACGAGHPMLDLVQRGHDVWGIDSSQDMLDLCAGKARDLGVTDKLRGRLHRQLMQQLDLPQGFAACYIAGASFCLIDRLEDAQQTLRRVYAHLTPNGAFLLSVFRPVLEPQPGAETSTLRDDHSRISVQSIAQTADRDEQMVVTRLRYRLLERDGAAQTVERDWKVRWYQLSQLRTMLNEAGFEVGSAYDFDGKQASDECCDFSVVARKRA